MVVTSMYHQVHGTYVRVIYCDYQSYQARWRDGRLGCTSGRLTLVCELGKCTAHFENLLYFYSAIKFATGTLITTDYTMITADYCSQKNIEN